MHYHANFFVHYQKLVVLIDDVDGNVLGNKLCIPWWIWHHHLHHIKRLYLVAALYRLVVHQYVACIGHGLNLGAAGIGQFQHQVFVYTQQPLPAIHVEAVVFV